MNMRIVDRFRKPFHEEARCQLQGTNALAVAGRCELLKLGKPAGPLSGHTEYIQALPYHETYNSAIVWYPRVVRPPS